MAYRGQQFEIPVGLGGLMTEDGPLRLEPHSLYRAQNVKVNGYIERDYGASKWNEESLGSGIVAIYDYWVASKQYVIAVTRDGKVYSYTDRYTKKEITAETGAPSKLKITERVHIVEGGLENVNSPKKLFIFTGNNPVQVIEGVPSKRRNLTSPAADWSGDNQPFFGIVFLGRLVAFGNRNLPHFVYVSTASNQEDFSTNPFDTGLANVFPGDGEKLQSAFIYKGRLHLLKYPKGLYGMEVQDIGNTHTWYFQKMNDDFGASSITATTAILDDVWVLNSDGAITSLSAAFKLGNIDSANIFKLMKVSNYIKQIASPLGVGERAAIYHSINKKAYFVYRSNTSNKNDMMLQFDFSEDNPRLVLDTKNQPNCIALIKDVNLLQQVFYGSDDGFIYEMNGADRSVNDSGYLSEFQTPHIECGAPGDKNFDFVEIFYVPTGGWNVSCDVFIENKKTETKSFYLGRSNQLDQFVLDKNKLQGTSIRSHRLPIHGRGKTISLRFYQSAANQNFKIAKIVVYFRGAGQNEKE